MAPALLRKFLLIIVLLLALDAIHGTQPVQQLPVGTLLPVMLNSGLNSDKSKPGQKITAKLKQDVPLPDHGVIKAGAEVSGRIVSVTRGSATAPAKLVFVADRLQAKGSDYPITTGLRALAPMAAVCQAREPSNGSSPDTVSVWEWNTRQIGGEIVFGG